MNRIILIGNGFDLAHGLKTSYKDFIDCFWEQTITEFKKVENYKNARFETNMLSINLVLPIHTQFLQVVQSYTDFIAYFEKEKELDKNKRQMSISFKNQFLKLITEKISLQNWVDIEEEYYNQLINSLNKDNVQIIQKLNTDFYQITQELEKYLIEKTKVTLYQNGKTKNLIYEEFNSSDFTNIGINKLIEERYYNYLEGYKNKDEKALKLYAEIRESINEEQIEDDKQYFEKKINKIKLPYPQTTLFLNFNYTNTSSKYVFQNRGNEKKQTIQIHGELNNPKNPIIFGYGDELTEEYYQIEKLNNNEYLKNVKSINYLKTDSYKRLLDFTNSDYYQIFIFGHSCGNSDRTLLNTLFEHDNCVSIKPFYYQKEDGTDNYEAIIMNISRNFKNKTAFRAKVVNKTYCKPLPQLDKAQYQNQSYNKRHFPEKNS